MKTYFKKLTDKQRKYLVRLRLANEHFGDYNKERHGVEITRIKIDSRKSDRFAYTVHTNKYHPECQGIILKRFFLNEVQYLLDQKIIILNQ